MRFLSSTGAGIRHATGAFAEAALIALIGAALVFGYAISTGDSPLGAGDALAAKGGKPAMSERGSTIIVNESLASLAFGDDVTFTTDATGLGGGEYPMVYLECRSTADDSVLYGQLDHPDVTFVLGGGSSPWWDVGGDARCKAWLYAYGGKSKGNDTIRELAGPVWFYAAG